MYFVSLLVLILTLTSNLFAATITDSTLKIGKGASDKFIIFDKGAGAANPKIKMNNTTSRVQIAHDGVNYYDVATDASAPVVISASNIDWSLGNIFTKTLSANTTFTFSNVTAKTIIVWVTNTASNYTLAWPSMIWTGGASPVQTIGAKTDICTLTNNGTTTGGSCVQDMY